MDKFLNNQIELVDTANKNSGPVKCLGMTFESNEARRNYFIDELKKKLPELKKIDGFPIGTDEDILALSDPPYYTACPNPFISDLISQWEKENEINTEKEPYHKEPFAADVSEGKNDPIYNAHSYHTKVPHKAIMRYILHYTEPGDIVFDGFAGTGMAGVAANLCGNKEEIMSLGYTLNGNNVVNVDEIISKIGSRKAILNDLSTAASFIAYNYNNPIDINKFQSEAEKIVKNVQEKCSWMYNTNHVINGVPQKDLQGKVIQGKINYVVWSDVFICNNCSNEIIFFNEAVDMEKHEVMPNFSCPKCNALLNKNNMDRAKVILFDEALGETIEQSKQTPVLIYYSVGTKRFTKPLEDDDKALLAKIDAQNLGNLWYPKAKLPNGYNTAQPMSSHGFTNVHHFYTKRNLIAVSCLLDEINKSKYRLPLKLAFQSIVSTLVTKLVRYNMGNRGNGVLAGTLYVASMVAETEVTKVFLGKVADFKKAFIVKENNCAVSTQSADSVYIPDNSIDYIFTDPPFGANIMYSELNFIWESWHKVITNNSSEAIVNQKQDKEIDYYQKMMIKCFENYYRILKPGRWMTVEFSNSQASVWNVIQEALQRAGFIIANVSALDKQQGSFKAVTTTVAVKQDLIISAYKPSASMINGIKQNANNEESAWLFVRNHLEQLPEFIGQKGSADIIIERTPRVLFDRMVAYHVQNGYSVPISSAEFQAGVAQRFPIRDGMVFLENQVAEYDKKRIFAKEFVQMSLFVSDENTAIEWLRQQLLKKPQTRQELHPGFMKEIQHISKYEKLPELDILLEQNFLKYDGNRHVPSQIHAYLSSNFKDLRELEKDDPKLQLKAKERWYVPDPNKQSDLEKLREKSLLREFAAYIEEISNSKKKLKQFRLEAIRAGFKKAWADKDFKTIVDVGSKIPENVLQEDDKLLMYYDNAQIRLGL